MHVCAQCGGRAGSYMTPSPDDCPHCGHPIRYAGRTDGKNLRARLTAQRRAALRYPPPPPPEDTAHGA